MSAPAASLQRRAQWGFGGCAGPDVAYKTSDGPLAFSKYMTAAAKKKGGAMAALVMLFQRWPSMRRP